MILSSESHRPDGIFSTDEVVASKIAVDLATDTWVTVLRVVVPCAAGDILDVHGWGRVTNDLGYTVGLGYHLWMYDVDDGLSSADRVWSRISKSKGDNVDAPRHHLPFDISCAYQVPDTWPEGHRGVVVLRADAHSTAWTSGAALTVDTGYGSLTVRRWREP